MPKLYINLFKEYRDLNSSFNSFKDFKNLSDYYRLFVFLTDSSSYKLHSTLELMEGDKFYLHKDQLGTPRAKHKIIKRPFKIEIYAYKLFFVVFLQDWIFTSIMIMLFITDIPFPIPWSLAKKE